MIKNCNVLINNEAVTVFDYDGIEIQVPSIRRNAKTIKVLYKNGKYTVVDDNYIEPVEKQIQNPAVVEHDQPEQSNNEYTGKKKRNIKKTTFDNSAKETISVTDDKSLTDDTE